jgi:hypothetical protein
VAFQKVFSLEFKGGTADTAIRTIIEGQVFQLFSGSQLVLKTVGSRFVVLNYYENGSNFVLRFNTTLLAGLELKLRWR